MVPRTSFTSSTNTREIYIFYKVCWRNRHKPAIHRLFQIYDFISRQVVILFGEARYFRLHGFTDEQIELLKRKGVFPYDYVSSFGQLKEMNLPSKDDFFSSLYNAHISDEDYEHAQHVWQSFNIQHLGQYSDLYLKTDVILLAEVFENFRNNCLAAYELDPAHYYITPGLSWDAILKNTQVLFT